PESTFLAAYGPALGKEAAQKIYSNAVDARIRNEHALVQLRETLRGTGIPLLDGGQSRDQRLATLQKMADAQKVPLDYSTLFADLDRCQCEDCLSVYSPASYFVELLQFLRNNDLQHDSTAPGIAGTPLEKLFRRRPDLGCLELTCANTNTV